MAKPRELYSGAAPQAMSLMGMGIADAYARAGEIEGKGYASLGQSIGEGLKSAGQYIKEVKEVEKQNRSYENLLKNDIGQKFLGVSAKDADQYLAMLKDEKPSVKNKLLSEFFNQSVKSKMFGMEQAGKKELQEMEMTSRGSLLDKELTARAELQKQKIAADYEMPYEQERAKSIYGKKDVIPSMSMDPFASIGGGMGGAPAPTPTPSYMPPATPAAALPQMPSSGQFNFNQTTNPFENRQRFGLGIIR